jgi:hypothetical protein
VGGLQWKKVGANEYLYRYQPGLITGRSAPPPWNGGVQRPRPHIPTSSPGARQSPRPLRPVRKTWRPRHGSRRRCGWVAFPSTSPKCSLPSGQGGCRTISYWSATKPPTASRPCSCLGTPVREPMGSILRARRRHSRRHVPGVGTGDDRHGQGCRDHPPRRRSPGDGQGGHRQVLIALHLLYRWFAPGFGGAAGNRGALRGPFATRGGGSRLRHSQARSRCVYARRLRVSGRHARRAGRCASPGRHWAAKHSGCRRNVHRQDYPQ